MLHLGRVLVGHFRSVPEVQMLACCLSRMLPVAMLCLGVSLVGDQWAGRYPPAFQKIRRSLGFDPGRRYFFQYEHEQHHRYHIAERAPPALRQRALETPTVGLEPTTTRLRALRSAD